MNAKKTTARTKEYWLDIGLLLLKEKIIQALVCFSNGIVSSLCGYCYAKNIFLEY